MEHSAERQDPFAGSLGIALIGMAARFPGANDIDEFWANLCAGKETIHCFSDEELKAAGVAPAELTYPDYVKAAPMLKDIELFDAAFFDYTPVEATFMDPQQRLLLECAWQALEDAGYTGERASDAIGVFAGIKMNTYVGEFFAHPERFRPEDKMQILMGNGDFALSTRISYKLNLKGPSYMLQTACSTSLAGLHLACQSLLLDECRMALVGATAVEVPHHAGYYYQYGGPASPDGHCRPFDARAQGTVFGSGVGMVVLKRLDDALADGDHIYAVIRGTAVNNDGAVKASFTAPGVEGQTQVILEALACANVDADSISYVEAHGTATPLGDPIEMLALTNAFRAGTARKGFCRVGSVKGNVGHLDATAGLAGLIKTVLALQHKQIPPSLYFERANPQIDFENSPFVVNTQLTEWAGPLPRRAGVSSFGFGSTNTHVILEEAPAVEPSQASRPWQLLLLSAKTSAALDAATTNLVAHLRRQPDLNLADVAHTLQVGRPAFKHRRAVVCRDRADALNLLENAGDPRVLTTVQESAGRPIVFMFPGQGAQHVNMGRELYQTEPVFREHVDRCAETLTPHLGLDLRTILYPDGRRTTEDEGRTASFGGRAMDDEQPSPFVTGLSPESNDLLNQTAITQPALFVVEYALAQLWQAWGVAPSAMIGHSIGEYVAACLAGVFSLEDALALVAARGRLMQQLPEGAMLSVALSEREVLPFLNDQLSLAAGNAPALSVVSGPVEAVNALQTRLAAQNIGYRRLHTSHAFHSSMMEPMAAPFLEAVKRVRLQPPQLPYLSNVTGGWITAAAATDPQYWVRHMRQTVRFGQGIQELAREPDRVLLEVGPGRTLSALAVQQLPPQAETAVFASMRHPQQSQSDAMFLLTTLGQLWSSGQRIDWRGFYARERRRRLPLPTYPFERQRYWIEVEEDAPARSAPLVKNPNLSDWFYLPSWKRTLLPLAEPQATPNSWLVLSDGDNLSTSLGRQLEARGHRVVMALAGQEFSADGTTYILHPARRADYDRLWAMLVERGQTPTQIVHLWNTAQPDAAEADCTETALQRSFYSLLFLTQALARHNPGELHLSVVSSNLHQVTGSERVQPEKAALLGPCKVIPQEMPNVACRSIDIELPADAAQAEHLAAQLLAELEADATEPIVAYRGENRWAQAYEPAALPDVKGAIGRLRERGVYLITGGLGGIGLTLAEYLAHSVQARLVLTTRAPFPAREAWDQYLATHDLRDRTGLGLRTVRELEARGAEVLIVQADVADRAQMEAAIRAARDRFGALHGVIHAAGLPGGGVMQLKTEDGAAQVMRPKIQGTRVLEAALRDAPLDFWVLCSSVAALMGGVGQADYCAANAFMDAFAQARPRRDSAPVVSINWDTWGKVGMAVNTALTYAAKRSTSLPATQPVEHPLLRYSYPETSAQTIYPIELNPAEQWVLSEHRLFDLPTLPGTAYLDLACAAFTAQTHSAQLEIREAMFLEPLSVGQGDSKEVRLVLEQRAETFDFRVLSKAGVAANGDVLWQTHASGHLAQLADPTPPQHDLETIRARCNVSEMVLTAEAVKHGAMGGEFLEFGPRWYNTLKRIQIGHDEGLALLSLDEDFLADLAGFTLHPALLDVGVSFAVGRIGSGRYLPVSYRQARIYRNLPGTFYSYARLKPGSATGGETLTFQITLLDEHGQALVDIQELILKRIGESAVARRYGSEAAPAATLERPSTASEVFQRDFSQTILPEEGVEAFKRVLARNSLPQIVVCPRHLPTVIQQASQSTPESLLHGVAPIKPPVARHVRPNLSTPYTAPRSDTERLIAEIWQELVGIEPVGVYDNFFDLGGHSLLAMQIGSRVREAFKVDLPLTNLFENPTVAFLAEYIDTLHWAGQGKSGLATAEPASSNRREEIEL
ncbi:MAG TPA: SDR family NAD(P)-dependent oxidoreductase [Anaerolineae bacterium]|nr:SDR family NAD(P)-dependent oxidoreductase [Anaerolineae bacterium]